MTTTTELYPLTRTLTDVLDDELYHMSANMGQDTVQTPKTWKNRSLEDLLAAPDHSSHPSYDSDDFKQSMFSKYADPSLTTLSMQKPNPNRKSVQGPPASRTPVQATVSLNNVMNVNPFASRLPSTTPEVRISSPALFQGEDEDMLNSGNENFPSEIYYDDSNNQKMFSWPLQESATMSQDAMSIFDREFGDDLSDDDDEEDDDEAEPDFAEEDHTQNYNYNQSQPETCNHLLPQEDDSLIFDRSRPGTKFVDCDSNDHAIADDDEEDGDRVREEEDLNDNSFAGDVLYDARKSSVVCLDEHYDTAPSSTQISRESSLPPDPASFSNQSSISLSSLPTVARKKKYPSRRKSSNATSSTPSAKKKLSPLSECSALPPSMPQEVHTCEILNPITKDSCGKKFSRPYDLIRHQKTIHASKKKVFRCVICIQQQGAEGYEKTFSRGDALSRHIKVKHDLTGPEAQKAIQFAKENVEFAGA
ncbi:LANO_0G06106g1_1 [Lachancea nothofagi CBS 11611]|uniref:LANO_0G06106g1_1 n=1 Tax=Lachancea nothofagi CBS 11611 TaxID=1266666 RepID=A0A1G4KGX8_9SACH|nr:LANO_0G06106g1_1 [Lachancea nothofagi CBS 11611]